MSKNYKDVDPKIAELQYKISYHKEQIKILKREIKKLIKPPKPLDPCLKIIFD